jgi:hypothetical protein
MVEKHIFSPIVKQTSEIFCLPSVREEDGGGITERFNGCKTGRLVEFFEGEEPTPRDFSG